jgi:hypothetical protein
MLLGLVATFSVCDCLFSFKLCVKIDKARTHARRKTHAHIPGPGATGGAPAADSGTDAEEIADGSGADRGAGVACKGGASAGRGGGGPVQATRSTGPWCLYSKQIPLL